jgi:hypothetical protein
MTHAEPPSKQKITKSLKPSHHATARGLSRTTIVVHASSYWKDSFGHTEAELMYNFLRFLGKILVLKLEVFVYNVYRTNQFQTTFARGGGGGG